MKRIVIAAITLVAAVCGCTAQSVVKMNVAQNPLFEVSTNYVTVSVPDSDSAVLGGDLVIAGGSGNYTYRWYDAAGAQLGTEPTLAITHGGVYYLDVKDTCDCLQTVQFNVQTAGIDGVLSQDFTITPSPTDGLIAIRGIDCVQLAVTDMSGRMRMLVDRQGDTIAEADLSALGHGQYIVTVTDAAGRSAAAIIIRK